MHPRLIEEMPRRVKGDLGAIAHCDIDEAPRMMAGRFPAGRV
ncbi:hypothetical protein EBBID32_23040 [Sphingobium indicum BiD32]|uniref:Uncharacterized protein n=1 Tax=Sphingobium indicum BiD32 TaxID=1301087 RepID=N1ML41_9SPHN|nr:hypothetical protein EBBID32_23040 [Sphingobium indicum BiD32]